MHIVPEHRIIARECTGDDARTILRAALDMAPLFGHNTVALAHPQVEDKEPLRFFVLADPRIIPDMRTTIIINPRIIKHSGYTVDSREGCQTYPEREHKTVQRWRRADVEYQTLNGTELSPVCTAELKAFPSFVFQHELDHLDGHYCYDEKQ